MIILRYPAMVAKCGFSQMTIRRKLTDPRYIDPNFPKPIRLGDNSVGFVESEVDDWLAKRMAERDGGDDVGAA